MTLFLQTCRHEGQAEEVADPDEPEVVIDTVNPVMNETMSSDPPQVEEQLTEFLADRTNSRAIN